MNPWGDSWGATSTGGGGPDGIEEHLSKQRQAGVRLYAKQPDALPVTASALPVAASLPPEPRAVRPVFVPQIIGSLEDAMPRLPAASPRAEAMPAKKVASPTTDYSQEEEEMVMALLHLDFA